MIKLFDTRVYYSLALPIASLWNNNERISSAIQINKIEKNISLIINNNLRYIQVVKYSIIAVVNENIIVKIVI